MGKNIESQNSGSFEGVDAKVKGDSCDVENPADDTDESSSTPFASTRNPRIYIPRELAQKVVKLGVPNESGHVGRVVSGLADQAIDLGQGWLPSASDVVAVMTAIEHRLNELATIHVGTIKMLTVIASITEKNSILRELNANITQEGNQKV